MKRVLRLALSPPAEISKVDTGLRFTDILFGFVIRELFLRLQNWNLLDSFVRWQLIAATALVLGSWIGFRRSLNRTTYEVKFVNLPLLRFLLDQGMVVLYFRIAVLTPTDPKAQAVSSASLVHKTTGTLAFIFLLYALWDVGNFLMAASPKYPLSTPDWPGFGITVGAFVLVGWLWIETRDRGLDGHGAVIVFIVATGLLLIYRWAKEVRNSLRLKTVPDVRGEDEVLARHHLEAAGLPFSVLDAPTIDQNRAGLVVDQNPAAGLHVPAGSVVSISVGRFCG